jgi:hypothetical protein
MNLSEYVTRNSSTFFTLLYLLPLSSLCAQDDLADIFKNDSSAPKSIVFATFKSSRIINARSNETAKKGELDFTVSHRFGDAAGKYGGIKTFFGTDNAADIRLSFDYGITNNLTVGLSRAKGATAIRELYEGSLKYRLLNQGNGNMPFAVTIFANAVASGMESNINKTAPDHFENFSDRWSFTGQLILARKVSTKFSVVLIPSFVHYNYVSYGDQNDHFAVGAGGRFKLTKRFSFLADYFYTFRDNHTLEFFSANGVSFFNPLGVGMEVETGGHVFQITFTNNTGLLENQFIPYTTTSWGDNQFRWGFHMSRTFSLEHRRK